MTISIADIVPEPWRDAFEALVRSRLRTPFRWGEHDCCLWAADAVLAQTGRDPAAPHRGTYADEAGAAALLATLGGLEALGALAGEPIAPLMACVGDVGLVVAEDREMLGVCAGTGWLVAGTRGLVQCPLTDARMAWRVAHG